jgi:hypothetical protein
MMMRNFLGTVTVLAMMFGVPPMTQAEESECGTAGTLEQRLAQCDRTVVHQGYRWALVTRTPSGNEVWRDSSTGFLWSDRAPETFPLRQARDFCSTLAHGSDVLGQLPVDFALPEIWEVRQAEKHGLSQVFASSSQGWFWSSTLADIGSLRVREAIIYNGVSGGNGPYDLNSRFAVRCVSRPAPER